MSDRCLIQSASTNGYLLWDDDLGGMRAKTSRLETPFREPTARITSPLGFATYRSGPSTHLSGSFPIISAISASKLGCIGNVQSSVPPKRFGRSSGAIYSISLSVASDADKTQIFFVVAGSNHRVMKLQMVGKKDGAPTTKMRSTVSG